jgi:hypothetical protein
MAEWLGQLMANWPDWAVYIAAVIIFIGGASLYFNYYAGESGSAPQWKRRKHDKK